ncbi:unnamed protein product, partial [Scytosiphon promiscuus]
GRDDRTHVGSKRVNKVCRKIIALWGVLAVRQGLEWAVCDVGQSAKNEDPGAFKHDGKAAFSRRWVRMPSCGVQTVHWPLSSECRRLPTQSDQGRGGGSCFPADNLLWHCCPDSNLTV